MQSAIYVLHDDTIAASKDPSHRCASPEPMEKRIEEAIVNLEAFFQVGDATSSSSVSPAHIASSSLPHHVGDLTQLVVAGSNLLRISHLRTGRVKSNEQKYNSDINRILRVLTAATNLSAEKKGLKFSVAQIAEYVSNLRFLNRSNSSAAQELIFSMGARYLMICGIFFISVSV